MVEGRSRKKTAVDNKKKTPKKKTVKSKEKASPAKTKATKKKKDKDAPKKGLSAFMFFSKEQRDTAKKNNPDASFGDIGRILGEMWRQATDKDKKKYEQMAEKDKARYEKEMAAYKK
eukprot:GFYU01000731.1.p1 GENE.GFYU01000731.1~~GFYU01000731.1.p1  ORF type:complete len:131 (-),score=63.44 GFYU01000731.1:335-685(-)